MHKNATRQLVNERTSLPNLNMSSVSQRFKPKGRPTPRCSTDGGFLLHQLSAWPARGTFLDDGLAKGIAQLVGNATVLDVGAGSGQYGACSTSCAARAEMLPAGVASMVRVASQSSHVDWAHLGRRRTM